MFLLICRFKLFFPQPMPITEWKLYRNIYRKLYSRKSFESLLSFSGNVFSIILCWEHNAASKAIANLATDCLQKQNWIGFCFHTQPNRNLWKSKFLRLYSTPLVLVIWGTFIVWISLKLVPLIYWCKVIFTA